MTLHGGHVSLDTVGSCESIPGNLTSCCNCASASLLFSMRSEIHHFGRVLCALAHLLGVCNSVAAACSCNMVASKQRNRHEELLGSLFGVELPPLSWPFVSACLAADSILNEQKGEKKDEQTPSPHHLLKLQLTIAAKRHCGSQTQSNTRRCNRETRGLVGRCAVVKEDALKQNRSQNHVKTCGQRTETRCMHSTIFLLCATCRCNLRNAACF